MENSIYRISLELHSEVSTKFLTMKKGDTARQIHAVLTDGGKPYRITEECYAAFRAEDAQGNKFSRSCEISFGKIVYTVSPAVLKEPGELACEFRLFGVDDKVIACPKFTIVVADSLVEDDEVITEEAKNELAGVITDAIVATDAAKDVTEQAVAAAGAADTAAQNANSAAEAATNAAENAEQVKKDVLAAKENGEFDGQSVTHEWDGTVLKVTSASGTSQADLKGDKGDKGDKGETGSQGRQGIQGEKGEPGYTPLAGVDFYTPEEKTAFQKAVEANVAQMFAATAIVCTAEGEQIALADSANYPLQGLAVYGKSVQDGASTIVSAGAANGYIGLYIPQAYSGAVIIRNPRDVSAPIGESVQFDVMAAGPGLTYQWQFNDGYAWSDTTNTGYDTPVLTIQALAYRVGYKYRCKVTATDGTEAISEAATLSEGEAVSYGACTYGIDPQLRIDTPGGLLGIPVSSGGNYNEDGQQWISDVVRSSGQKEQNVGYIASYAGEDIPGPYISSTGDLSIGAEVLYALAEPVVTELGADVVAAFAALRTYKPNTTIINDAGAGMKMEYVADPKTYIDNKFAELATAMAGS